MYAVIQTGGKQYRVQPGDLISVEKLAGDIGAKVKFDQVLFAAKPSAENSLIWLGKPLLSGATVDAQIVDQGRGKKELIIKMKRRKDYRRVQGHRQELTSILILGLNNGAGETSTLSDAELKTTLSKFQRSLTPKGQAFTPKTLGSRKRMKAAAAAKTEKTAAPKKTAAKK
jgi:large subunit ribosomal protein L21